MKGKSYLAIMAVMLPVLSDGAMAVEAGKGYLGAQYGFVTYSESGIPDYNPSALVVRGGYHFSQYVSVEGRYGFGVSDDTNTILGVDVKLKIDNLYGLYAVGHLPLSKSFELYGVAGFSSGKLTASALGVSDSASEDDLSFGVGAEFFMNRVSFSLEYMSYMRKSDFDVSAFGLGVNFMF